MVSIRNKKSQVAMTGTKNKLGSRRTKSLQKELDLIKSEKGLEINPRTIQNFEIVKKPIGKDDILTTVNLKINETFGLWTNYYKKSGEIGVLFGYNPSNLNNRPLFVL